ncbi:MAG: hypothetical protein F4Y24_17130 [Gemmatimonadetes bacterium]|nr:hypothetical protein [Gemmatimonadota bacterium]MYG21134.1 hypothetical protein [Gemmatimonadota bacterium]MYJ38014.1 hypothetical protein [Gemmatimonadota bacterium]
MIAKSRIIPVISLLLLAGVNACGGGDDGPSTPQEPPRPATIMIEPASATLTYISQTTAFSATVRDQYGAAMAATVTWSSSDGAVFTVDGSGQVTAAGNGSGTLQASSGTLNATASVTVEQRAALVGVISGNNQEAPRGMKLAKPVVVRLEDRGGHGVAGVEIGFAPGAESGSVSVESVTSDDSGQGTTDWTLGNKFGAQTLIISAPGGIQNRARATATSETPLADLSVETVTLSRTDPTDLETLDITATLANKGDAASPDTFVVHLTLDGIAQDSAKVARLEPEGRTTLDFTAGPFEAGNRRLAVVIDPERRIDEWEKENNTKIEILAIAHQEIVRVGHTSNISATLDEVLLFRIDLEEGSKEAINIEVSGGQGDPDLFVNYGFRPDHHYKYSCISGAQPGTAELCQLLPARTGSYHVAVHAYSTFGPVELKISVGGIEVESYDIDVVFIDHGSAEQDKVVLDAARKWESVIVQGVTDIDLANSPIEAGQCVTGSPIVDDVIDDVRMFVRIDSIDGPGKVLARAGPCLARVIGFEGYPDIPRSVIAGAIEFDEDDLNGLSAQGILLSTVLHEMGHVLGFGAMWDAYGLLENHSISGNSNADTHFTGPLARRAFERAGGRNYRGGAIVPVENGGTQGSADSHWRESVFENELMTPFLSAGIDASFSIITIESMADLGFSVDPSVADSYRIANTSGAGRGVDPESVIDLSNDIADYPIVFIDQKGRRVHPVDRRR